MRPVKRTLISIRTGGHTIDLCVSYLDKASFRLYKSSHRLPKSAFYRPIRLEWGLELGKRGYSIHYKQDL